MAARSTTTPDMVSITSPIIGWILTTAKCYFVGKTVRNLADGIQSNAKGERDCDTIAPTKTTKIARARSTHADEQLPRTTTTNVSPDDNPADHCSQQRMNLKSTPSQHPFSQTINSKWGNQMDADDGWLQDEHTESKEEEEDTHQKLWDAPN